MATDPPGDLELHPLVGAPRTLAAQLTTFHLAVVVLDPFTNESAWLIDSAGRMLLNFAGADVRVGFVVCGTPDEARQFLGPWADRLLTFADPDRTFAEAVGLERLPALVHVGQDATCVGVAEGWDPSEWRAVLDDLARVMSWTAPTVPAIGDPAPYAGSPALASA